VTTRYATAKQLELITRLSRERGLAVELGGLTIENASELIRELFNAPRSGRTVQVTQVGMYRNAEGVIFKVQLSKAGRLYAKQLNASGRGFAYSQGAIMTLTPADRMSLVDAQAFGVATGNCCVCGRELTDQNSVAQGIGPVCARNWFN